VWLAVTATDVRPPIIELARRWSAAADRLDIQLATPDKLDFADNSFDVVHSSMVLHHLEPGPAVGLLREMGRVARSGVIVNDLERGYLWWLGAWLWSHFLTRNRYTRHDAPLSVRRAYRANEMSALAASAGLREIDRFWTVPHYRYALVLTPA
jgi:SAM-dependent methyltransferase